MSDVPFDAARAKSSQGQLGARLDRLRGSGDLKGAAEQFESLFLEQLFKSMRRTIPKEGGLFPRSNQQEFYTELLDRELAQRMAESGRGLGVAAIIDRAMGEDPTASDLGPVPGSDPEWSVPEWTMPLDGEVVREYGLPTEDGGLSTELLLAGEPGEPVAAPARGRVVALRHTPSGAKITIDHGRGLRSVVAGLAGPSPRLGEIIEEGAPLGTVFGRSGRGFVSFSATEGGVPVDPCSFSSGRSSESDYPFQVFKESDDVGSEDRTVRE